MLMWFSSKWFLYPRFNEVERGYTGITLSVCPSVDRVVSALYLQEYSSDPFHIRTSYQATSEGVSRVRPVSKFKNLKFWWIFLICNFDFVFLWLGIQYDSVVWVIMRRWGYPQNAGILVVLVMYRQTSNTSRTKSQHLNVFHLVLQLSLPSPLKQGVKLRMKL